MTSDEEWIRGLQAGGRARSDALAGLYRRHARRMVGYFRRQRLSRAQAEDLAQDVFVRMVRHCEGFRGDAKASVWMWSIARNALLDHVRRARNRPDGEPLDPDDDSSPAAAVAAPDDTQDVDRCVRSAYADFALAYPDRAETLALVAFEGWSLVDLARVLGRTHGAAREYVSQCRAKLRPYLERCRELLAA